MHSSYKTVTGKHLPLASYQFQLIWEILTKYSKKSALNKTGRPCNSDTVIPMRLTDKHFPCNLHQHLRRQILKDGVMYAKNKRKDTTFMCKKCDVGLCPAPCFEIYHTNNKI